MTAERQRDSQDPYDFICDLYENGGGQQYGAEAVTQLEHALQCAHQAEREGASSALIVAALLHDIGHLLAGDEVRALKQGEDLRHETGGANFLTRWFDEEVTAPVRLHVPAKRYLVATEADYAARLSPASTRSLELQGGAFSPAEAEDFRRQPGATEAIRLRRWDEGAKIAGAETPGLDGFRKHIDYCLRSRAGGNGSA